MNKDMLIDLSGVVYINLAAVQQFTTRRPQSQNVPTFISNTAPELFNYFNEKVLIAAVTLPFTLDPKNVENLLLLKTAADI